MSRYQLVQSFLDELDFPYDDGCVNFIVEDWEKDHKEQLVDVDEDDMIEIDREDVESYWFFYVKEKLFD